MPFTLVIKPAGRANVVNPANTGTAAATITQVGVSATAIDPATATALTGELKRMSSVGGSVVADDTIHVSMLDESGDAYTCRSVALYLGDGTLFALASGADPLFEKTAGSHAATAFDIVLADIAATLISFGATNFMEVTATTERAGLVELATLAEAAAGIDALRALTPASAKAAVLGWLLTQDGSGSGLDADLLDGFDSSYFTNIIARLGYTPVNKAGDAMAGQLTLVGDPTAAGHAARKAYVDALVGGAAESAASILAKLLTVDGSGCGLDADLLDGFHAAAFRRVVASSIAENGGYLKYADGLIDTWGYIDLASDSGGTFILPTPHQTWVNPVFWRQQNRYGDNFNNQNIYVTSINVDGSGHPISLTVWNGDDFTNRVYIQTRGY